MKILLVTEFFPRGKDLRYSGGVESRTFFLAKNLASKNNIAVIASKQKGEKEFEKIGRIKVYRPGPATLYTETPPISQIPRKIRFIFSAIKLGCSLNPDILDGSNYIGHLIAKQISIRTKTKVVFWYPDVFIGSWLKNAGFAGIFGWSLEKFNLLRGADHFIAISKSTARKLLSNGVNSRDLTTIPCGVDSSEFKIKIGKKTTKKIICVSRLVPYKRTKDLVLAFALLSKKYPNLLLTIIGSGPEKGKLTSLVKNLKLTIKIRFKDNLPRTKLVNEIKSSYLFCLPSVVEGFGISVLEAAAAGVPFVISDIEVFKEITQQGKGGLLFQTGSIKGLCAKIEKLLSDENLYSKKINEARNLASKYQWSDIANQTESLYKSLIK
jgi:glycosyltransferase involved in cell wall biosynthesis